MGKFTTAYAGSADLTEENVSALLDQLLPEDLGMIYIPERVTRSQPGLRKTVKWLEGEVGEDGTIPVPDLVKALVERRDSEGDDVALVLVLDPASGIDNSIAREAHEAGIRVIDLASGGDDMVFDTPAEEPPFDVDEPPAEAAEKPAAEPGTPSPADAVAKASAAGVAAAKAHSEQQLAGDVADTLREGVGVSVVLQLGEDTISELARAIVKAMGEQAQRTLQASGLTPTHAALDQHDEPAATVTPITQAPGAGKAPKDPQPEGTVVYYYNAEEAKYRPARGRLRAGEERVFLTPEQVSLAKDKKMLG